MLNTILETPWYAMGLGVIFIVGFFAAWIQTGSGKLLWGCLGSFIVFGGLVALEAIVMTERNKSSPRWFLSLAPWKDKILTKPFLSYTHLKKRLAYRPFQN